MEMFFEFLILHEYLQSHMPKSTYITQLQTRPQAKSYTVIQSDEHIW